MKYDRVFEEVTFQARLKYLAFKRLIWGFEVIVLMLVTLLTKLLRVPTVLSTLVIAVQLARVITEMCNHAHLAQLFNVRDKISWFTSSPP